VADLAGTPSDEVPAILATGRSDVTNLFVSMSARHPEGRDAEWLEWHSLDHRPEQHRLPGLRASLRIVSTPACRAARAASTEAFDAVDHVMTYMFSGIDKLEAFQALSSALGAAGRKIPLLPTVRRGAFTLHGLAASPRIKVGADVLPWWPARGVYLLVEEIAGEIVEEGAGSPPGITDDPGVGGVMWASGMPVSPANNHDDNAGLQITYCFLDDDPVAVAGAVRATLEKRWADTGAVPLLAAPFYILVSYEWNRYLP
jgi:hypothetical protein